MEMHQIRYFLGVQREHSFTRAAGLCHVSQPSLSAQIRKLEEELGGELFERSRKRIRLTARGELFLQYALEVEQRTEELWGAIQDFDNTGTGKIALGCLPTTGAHVLPPLLTEFSRTHPDVKIQLQEGSSPALAQALLDFDIDLAILDEAGLKPGLQSTPLFQEPLYIALPGNHHLSTKTDLQLEDLKNESFILMRKTHGFHSIVISALRDRGVEPHVVYESSEIETVQSLVEAGLGISLVPRMVCSNRNICYRSGGKSAPSRTLLLAWRKSYRPPPAAQAFSELSASLLARRFGGEE
ncbi:LysR family transcriptional regulator [Salinispira pacifica]|uniref:Transcriptional regulator, LysR family n=1 Tax=Salinispira pacifica TaxID=1307761 RepID=V5WJY7_9SPIO|nr:LysR family transcriptional regulator [Salinispira pacifica]AHC16048.1 transcriptional regulator, LysR family [Salinispira pacifica]